MDGALEPGSHRSVADGRRARSGGRAAAASAASARDRGRLGHRRSGRPAPGTGGAARRGRSRRHRCPDAPVPRCRAPPAPVPPRGAVPGAGAVPAAGRRRCRRRSPPGDRRRRGGGGRRAPGTGPERVVPRGRRARRGQASADRRRVGARRRRGEQGQRVADTAAPAASGSSGAGRRARRSGRRPSRPGRPAAASSRVVDGAVGEPGGALGRLVVHGLERRDHQLGVGAGGERRVRRRRRAGGRQRGGAVVDQVLELVEPGAGEVEQRLAAGVAGQGQLGLLGAALEPVERRRPGRAPVETATSVASAVTVSAAPARPAVSRVRQRAGAASSRAAGEEPLQAGDAARARACGRRPSRPAGRGWRRGRRGRARRRGAAPGRCRRRDDRARPAARRHRAVVARSPGSSGRRRARRPTPARPAASGPTSGARVFGYGRRRSVFRSSQTVREQARQPAHGAVLQRLDRAVLLAHDLGGLGHRQPVQEAQHDALLLLAAELLHAGQQLLRWSGARRTASSGPSVARSASRMSAVATSSRYRLLFTWSRMMLRAIVTSQAPDVAALEGQRVDPAQRPHEGLAGDVLGRRPVADPVVDVAVDQRHVVVVELAERLGVALLRAAHQRPDVDAVGGSADGSSRRASSARRRRPSPSGAGVDGRAGLGRWPGDAASGADAAARPAAPAAAGRSASRGWAMRAIDLLVGPPSLDRLLPARRSGRRARVLRGWPHGDNIAPARPREPARTRPSVHPDGCPDAVDAAPTEERVQ